MFSLKRILKRVFHSWWFLTLLFSWIEWTLYLRKEIQIFWLFSENIDHIVYNNWNRCCETYVFSLARNIVLGNYLAAYEISEKSQDHTVRLLPRAVTGIFPNFPITEHRFSWNTFTIQRTEDVPTTNVSSISVVSWK